MAAVEMDTKQAQLREIRVSLITVATGFNPRGEVQEDEQLRALAETMRARGCLQPIRVRESETGGFVLVAGERRYRAAALAGMKMIPATVLRAGAGDEAERIELLSDAVIENELRSNLDPLQRARGYKAMLGEGLTVRGIAERLGGSNGRRGLEARIREHLQILELPDSIAERVAAGEVPLLAVKALLALARIHGDLAQAAVASVLDVEEHEQPYTWQEVTSEPLAVAVNNLEELPLGLYNTSRSHPIGRFTLSEKAQHDLRSYERLTGGSIEAVRFAHDLLERPRALGAVHDCGWFAILADQEVADSVAEEYIATALKQERARRRRMKAADADGQSREAGIGADGEALAERSAGDHEPERQERERGEREEQRERREAAIRFNVELGLLVFKHLPKVKADERVLRILASVDLGGMLRQIALRGARYCLPGWVTEGTCANGSLKADYLEDSEVTARAASFLEGAESASDVAGRALTLIALAALADQDAIAQSRRCWQELSFRGPWAEQANLDLVGIVRERIKDGQMPTLDERLAQDAPLAPVVAHS